jgi:hypothetical protein
VAGGVAQQSHFICLQCEMIEQFFDAPRAFQNDFLVISGGAKQECREVIVTALINPNSLSQIAFLAKSSFRAGIFSLNLRQVPSAKPKTALFYCLQVFLFDYLLTIFVMYVMYYSARTA